MIRFFWETHQDASFVPLISAVLNHSEGKPATLIITVPDHHASVADRVPGKWGKLTYQETAKQGDSPNENLIFYGKTTEFLEKQGQVDITLISDQDSFQEQWPAVSRQIKAMNRHHDLWGDESAEMLLSTVPYTCYWDRCTGKLGISHAYKGKKTWDVSDCYDAKHRIVRKNKPLSQVKVQVSALWDQSILGYSDVAPQIAAKFQKGVMGTLTERAFESAWPETGRLFPSGYFVAHSMLRKRPASNHHPDAIVFHPPVATESNAAPPPSWVAECSFYDAKLVMGYFYRQKRKENLTYTLRSDLQSDAHGRIEYLDITLPSFIRYDDLPLWNPMMDYEKGDEVQHQGRVYRFHGDNESKETVEYRQLSRDGFDNSPRYWEEIPEKTKWLVPSVSESFFNQTLGQELFQYTLNKAKTALIWGTRCMEIQLRGTLKHFYKITLDDVIALNKNDGSDEKIHGKVVEYTMHMDGVQQVAYVQIKGAFFMDSNKKNLLPEKPILSETGGFETISEGLRCLWLKKDPAIDVVSQNLKTNICKRIEVINPIDQQLQHLESIQEKMWGDDWDPNSIQSKETRIRLHFHSLRTKECLEHTIPVRILTPYEPEKDI